MNKQLSPALRAEDTYALPVITDRFALSKERSQRSQPLMRKYEIASLLPCGDARTSHHLAPANGLFEATSSAFARDALIATPNGPIAVEDLLPGDVVDTVDGTPQALVWVSSTSYIPAQPQPNSTLTGLIRLVADGYSKAGAHCDLMLGPNARMLQEHPNLEKAIGVRSVLAPVRDLEDGYSAFFVSPPSRVKLFHLRLANHAAIYANGRAVETYHPGKGVEDQLGDNMRTLFLSLFPDIDSFADFGPLAYPRMSKDTLESLTRN
jgi:hypothetical protein